jgi:hypothetical protein
MSGLPAGVTTIADERGIDRRPGSSDVSVALAAKLEEAKRRQDERTAAALPWLDPSFRRANQAALEAQAEAERRARPRPRLVLAESHRLRDGAQSAVAGLEMPAFFSCDDKAYVTDKRTPHG